MDFYEEFVSCNMELKNLLKVPLDAIEYYSQHQNLERIRVPDEFKYDLQNRNKAWSRIVRSLSELQTIPIKTFPDENHKVNIIVPMLDHSNENFIPRLTKFLEKQNVKFKISFMKQRSPDVINIGALLNAGFLETPDDCDYVCFHTIDHTPMISNYRYSDELTFLSKLKESNNFRNQTCECQYGYFCTCGLISDQVDTSVFKCTKKAFQLVNGFSNQYRGWGCHDQDFIKRLSFHAINYTMYRGIYKSEPHSDSHMYAGNPYYQENLETLIKYKDHISDGLSTVKYTIIKREKLDERIELFLLDLVVPDAQMAHQKENEEHPVNQADHGDKMFQNSSSQETKETEIKTLLSDLDAF